MFFCSFLLCPFLSWRELSSSKVPCCPRWAVDIFSWGTSCSCLEVTGLHWLSLWTVPCPVIVQKFAALTAKNILCYCCSFYASTVPLPYIFHIMPGFFLLAYQLHPRLRRNEFFPNGGKFLSPFQIELLWRSLSPPES